MRHIITTQDSASNGEQIARLVCYNHLFSGTQSLVCLNHMFRKYVATCLDEVAYVVLDHYQVRRMLVLRDEDRGPKCGESEISVLRSKSGNESTPSVYVPYSTRAPRAFEPDSCIEKDLSGILPKLKVGYADQFTQLTRSWPVQSELLFGANAGNQFKLRGPAESPWTSNA